MKSFKTIISFPASHEDWNKEKPAFLDAERIVYGQIVWIDHCTWGNLTGNKIYYLNNNKVVEWVFSCRRITINH